MSKADIGLIGLAVMGENLVLNMESKGFTVAVYNRTVEKVNSFILGRGAEKEIIAADSIENLVSVLKRPRKVMLMVKAGRPVDDFIQQLIPYLEEGDIIIDGGNSFYKDTQRRTAYVESKGLQYIGTGISGGEEGALKGPSIMPGGSVGAWEQVKPIFQAIAAKVENDIPCCDWVGSDGAGHFVKMVHNGIEYGDMQGISEAYFLMKKILGLSSDEIHTVFKQWNQGELNSYLVEITSDIFAFRDDDGQPLVEKIKDTAGQKGTGKWSVQGALDYDVPLTFIAEAVLARTLSMQKDERSFASKVFSEPEMQFSGEKNVFIEDIGNALYASKIVSYAQGFALLQAASKKYSWNIDYGATALLWRGGCIIRSSFLEKIRDAFKRNSNLSNLLVDTYFKERIENAISGWRRVVAEAATNGIPVPCISSALNYFDGYRTAMLPANLLQAQRDYFGAHMYQRLDRPDGEFFHTNWTGSGGSTASTAYNV